ncbi:membrane protein [Mesorhizobium loti]|uniref:membrane protein n=1 Tax=Rhizobium loti TaxID=381 RepID=UPI00040EFAA6|nr:membrane protein [Mesorhizobium loti]
MQPVLSDVEVSRPTESSSTAVNWGPIIAGAFAACTLTFTLMLLGSGLGLTMVSPWSGSGASVTTFAVSTAVWLVIVQWLSAGVGGYLAGRLRTKWVNVHTDEVYFRDTAHGFLAWALATLLVVGVLGSALSGAVGSGAQAVTTIASDATMGASAGASANAGGAADNATSYFVDSLFRPNDPSKLAAANPQSDAAATAQATHILIAGAAAGDVSADDKTYLSQLVSARTGLSEADAKARVDAVLAKVQDAKVRAKQVADTARKATITLALLSALSLVIGAFVASAAAALGGRQRDEEGEAIFLAR